MEAMTERYLNTKFAPQGLAERGGRAPACISTMTSSWGLTFSRNSCSASLCFRLSTGPAAFFFISTTAASWGLKTVVSWLGCQSSLVGKAHLGAVRRLGRGLGPRTKFHGGEVVLLPMPGSALSQTKSPPGRPREGSTMPIATVAARSARLPVLSSRTKSSPAARLASTMWISEGSTAAAASPHSGITSPVGGSAATATVSAASVMGMGSSVACSLITTGSSPFITSLAMAWSISKRRVINLHSRKGGQGGVHDFIGVWGSKL